MGTVALFSTCIADVEPAPAERGTSLASLPFLLTPVLVPPDLTITMVGTALITVLNGKPVEACPIPVPLAL